MEGKSIRTALVWAAIAIAVAGPIAAAATSPLLEWRRPVYITAGFAGVVAFALMLAQPLLIGGYLPGLSAYRSRRAHRWVGGLIVASVVLHVGGLWITSPPDVIDALVFNSPTPFSPWGVVAMWAIFAVALLAALRRPLRLRLSTWRITHAALAVVIVAGTVVHALLVEGTMETFTKAALCVLVVVATVRIVTNLKVWPNRPRSR